MLVLDIETLGIESTCVVLSCAIVRVDVNYTYEQLVKDSVFVKFNAKEQIEKYNRTVTKSTLDWWNKQCDFAKNKSFKPSTSDVSVEDGFKTLRNFIGSSKSDLIFCRGNLDQMVIDSLAHSAGIEPLAPYNHYRDVRTAVDILHSTSKNGYCDVNPPFKFNRDWIIKHDPIHDCVLDAMMILYGV